MAQNSSSGLAIALLSGSDWTNEQRVEADITATFGTGSWVGLVARYVDADNYYYTVIRSNQTYGIYKRVNGVVTLLYANSFYDVSAYFPRLDAREGQPHRCELQLLAGSRHHRQLPHARACRRGDLLARADFDDVHVAGTDVYPLFAREYGFGGNDYASGLDELSGDWEVIEVSDDEESYLDGLAQRDTSGNARRHHRHTGAEPGNQRAHAASMRSLRHNRARGSACWRDTSTRAITIT